MVEADAGADDAADGEEAEAKAEDVDEHDPGPEDGRADADEGDDHRAVVERRRAVDRGDDAGRDADDERDHERGGAELDRGPEELAQLTGDRLVGADRVAEIEREGGLQEVGVLDRQGLVETELLADARDLLDAPLVAGHGRRGIAGDQLDHDEDGGHDPEEHRDGEEQAARDVSGHRRAVDRRSIRCGSGAIAPLRRRIAASAQRAELSALRRRLVYALPTPAK